MEKQQFASQKIRFPSPINSIKSVVSERNKSNFDSYNPSYSYIVSDADSLNNQSDSEIITSRSLNRNRPSSLQFDSFSHSPNVRSSGNPSPFPFRKSIFGREQSKKVRICDSFEKLQKAILKLFLGKELGEEEKELSLCEFEVLLAIFVKKFKGFSLDNKYTREEEDSFKLASIQAMNIKLRNEKSTKRVEENNKFIFKFLLKHLKKTFYSKKNIDPKKKFSEMLFYRFYFRDLSRSDNIDINNFYDPLYRPGLKNKCFKSFNNEYIRLVFRSKSFFEDFKSLLESDFRQLYLDFVTDKIKEILFPLKKTLMDVEQNEEQERLVFENFSKEFERKKRFKLPWTVCEMECAIQQFIKVLSNY